MLSYLWLMTSPRLVLAGYRLMMLRPCACFTSMYFQSLLAAHALVMIWRPVCTFCRSFLAFYGVGCFLISYFLRPCFLWGFCQIVGFLFSSLSFYQIGFCQLASFSHISIALPLFLAISLWYSCYDVIWSKPAGPLWACYLWLNIVIWAFSVVLLAGSCVPFVFSWASLAHLLSLGFLGPFPNFAFPYAFY